MNVDSIKTGVVIDHISAGRGLRLFDLLGLDEMNCQVAIIKNTPSKRMGRKDIIKVDANIPLNLDVVGYIDPGATVNLICDGKVVEKKTISKPEILTDVIRCKNPRCISTVEQELPQIFRLTGGEHGVYRCLYCETKADEK